MKRMMLAGFFGFMGPLVLLGCYYDDEETLYPESSACTAVEAPAFTSDVLPLLQKRCNSCHGGSSPSGGIRLDTYAEVTKYATNGSLLGSITHASGYSAMPKNASKMPACEIITIENWINSGAPDN